MNRDKLKIKHKYNFYKLSPVYPSNEDILFEYIDGLEKLGLINTVFKNGDLRKLSEKLPSEYNNETEIMAEFINIGYFEEVNSYKKTNGTIIEYKLKFHPWM